MDIKTIFLDFTKGADYLLDGVLLADEDGFDTAIIISLFTDARALDDDKLPQGQIDRRGWWADAFSDEAGDRIGSRLWALPGKQTTEELNAAREYAEESLAWLVRDGAAKSVTVSAANPRDGLLVLSIEIEKPDATRIARRFEILWRN